MNKLTYADLYSQGLSNTDEHSRFERALSVAREADTRHCPHRVGDEDIRAGARFTRLDPSDRSRVVSESFHADQSVVDRAVAEARRAAPGWRAEDPEERAAVLEALAARFVAQRDQLGALVALEVGKTRLDALAEIDECVAILELFVRQYRDDHAFALALTSPSSAASAGLVYRPYGVFGVIAPFNFPIAISLGMAAGAILTGNTVVLKPSALTPASGAILFDLFREAGLPSGVLNIVQGGGETGALLARSQVDGLAFTGSAQVGLDLVRQLSQPPYVRPVIAELGGKSPGIVSDAAEDIEAAARAVARSAFGMTAQKCNACSRVLVFSSVYDDFVEALAAETQSLEIADPSSRTAFAGPLVSDLSVDRYKDTIATARAEGRLVTGGGTDLESGSFVELSVVDRLGPAHPITRNELFVPILSVCEVADLDAAMVEANAVVFGLSAGIFSSKAAEVQRFLDEIEAGIVFVNNPGGMTTGVWPGSQTMSGWKASGTTGKGGFGPYYLQQFVREQSRTIYQ